MGARCGLCEQQGLGKKEGPGLPGFNLLRLHRLRSSPGLVAADQECGAYEFAVHERQKEEVRIGSWMDGPEFRHET